MADEFADWSDSELEGLRGLRDSQAYKTAEQQEPFDTSKLSGDPKPLDWVERGAVNTPISQGRCGTCAQFS